MRSNSAGAPPPMSTRVSSCVLPSTIGMCAESFGSVGEKRIDGQRASVGDGAEVAARASSLLNFEHGLRTQLLRGLSGWESIEAECGEHFLRALGGVAGLDADDLAARSW